MQRMLQPELLDSLPPGHPDALHNRRDLRLTNRIVGNHRWFQRQLPPLLRPGERALELGAGTGELGQALGRRGVAIDGLDLWPRPEAWPPSADWHAGDLRAFAGYARYQALIGNFIFHQFPDGELRQLGAAFGPSVRLILACEPARRRFSQFLFRTLGPLLGANHVSLHDAHVSIAAGFRGDELPLALGLSPERWTVRHSITPLGIYRMITTRRS